MKCENTHTVPGPNPGCAEFAGPEEIPCDGEAVVTVVLDWSHADPFADDDALQFVHLCAECERSVSEGLHADPDYVTTYAGIVTRDEDRAALDASHPSEHDAAKARVLANAVETMQLASVSGVGVEYVVLWVTTMPEPAKPYLVQCDPSGPTTGPWAVTSSIEHEAATFREAMTWVVDRVEAEVAAERAS